MITAKSGRSYRSIPDGYDVEKWDSMSVIERIKALGLLDESSSIEKILDYVERNSEKLSNFVTEHGGLKSIRIYPSSPYPDCKATIFITCEKGDTTMGVKSMVSAKKIVNLVKEKQM